MVACIRCSTHYKWSKGESKKIWFKNEDVDSDDEDSHWFEWQYICIPCKAIEWDVPLNEARARVMDESQVFDLKVHRVNRYKHAIDNAQSTFPAIKHMKKLRKIVLVQLTQEKMASAWEPLGEMIIRKIQQLKNMNAENEEHRRLSQELKECTDPDRGLELLEQLEALDTSETSDMLAFKGELQDKFLLAASYSDTWTVVRSSTGKVIGGVRSWYVCLCDCKGKEPPCGTLILSKKWALKNTDPLAPRQGYYCHMWHKYNASWGQIVEITIDGAHYYMRAEVPSWDLEDIRAMDLESKSVYTSPEQLYNAVSEASPQLMSPDFMSPVEGHDGHFKVHCIEDLMKQPLFEWEQVFNFVGTELPPKKSGKRGRKSK